MNIDNYCHCHRDSNNTKTLPGVQFCFLRDGYCEDITKMQLHRVYEGSLTRTQNYVEWGFVSEDYEQGYDIALNDGKMCKMILREGILFRNFLKSWTPPFKKPLCKNKKIVNFVKFLIIWGVIIGQLFGFGF